MERIWFRLSTNRRIYEREYGLDLVQTEEYTKENLFQTQFQEVLFSRIIPNLKKIGLLPDEVVPGYEKLGVMKYSEASSDYELNWEELSKPLERKVATV